MPLPVLTVILNEDEPNPAKQNVVILRKWNAGQRQRVASLSMAPVDAIETQLAIKDGGRPRILIDIPKQRLETVKVCIESWQGPMFDDVAVTGKAVEELDPDIVDVLADACDRLNQGTASDEKKELLALRSSGS